MTFGVTVYDIRPSGHHITVWKGKFSCKNATKHKKDILKFLKQLETECPEHMKGMLNVSNAFVVYGSLGQPLAFFFKVGNNDFTEEEMSSIMKLFPDAKDNAETYIEWRETV